MSNTVRLRPRDIPDIPFDHTEDDYMQRMYAREWSMQRAAFTEKAMEQGSVWLPVSKMRTLLDGTLVSVSDPRWDDDE